MVKKDCHNEIIFYISLGLIIVSTVFLVISLSCCVTLLRKRRKNYCSNCRQIIKLENIIVKKGLSAVSHDSLIRVKRAISSSLTDNPEYDSVPEYGRDNSNNKNIAMANNPQYAPLSTSTYTTMRSSACSQGSFNCDTSYGELKLSRSKDSVVRIYHHGGDGTKSSTKSCKSAIESARKHPEYEYMRSPRLNKKMATYVNVKNSSVSINSSKSALWKGVVVSIVLRWHGPNYDAIKYYPINGKPSNRVLIPSIDFSIKWSWRCIDSSAISNVYWRLLFNIELEAYIW